LDWFYSQANPSITVSSQHSPISSTASLPCDSDDADISSEASSDNDQEILTPPVPAKTSKGVPLGPTRRSPSSYSDSAYSSIFGDDHPPKLSQYGRVEESPMPEIEERTSSDAVDAPLNQDDESDDDMPPIGRHSHESSTSTAYYTPASSFSRSLEDLSSIPQIPAPQLPLRPPTPDQPAERLTTCSTLPFPKYPLSTEENPPLPSRPKKVVSLNALRSSTPPVTFSSDARPPIEQSHQDWEALAASLRRARERRAQKSVRSAARERMWRLSGLRGVLEDAGRGGMQVELGFAVGVR